MATTSPEKSHPRLLPIDDIGLETAGKLIREGNLVGFPTETVYGLGANALDEDAVLSIFTAKGRPLTDPVIVHVVSLDSALEQELVQLAPRDREIVEKLATACWPGPLTIVMKANDKLISPKVTASSGFVGIRVPGHELARRLLEIAQRPIAAPSANRFGHVSPTSAQHVLDDLGHLSNVSVLDGGSSKEGACGVGIESTVLQVHGCNGDQANGVDRLVLFRKGGVSEQKLRKVLNEAGLDDKLVIEIPSKTVKHQEPTATTLNQPTNSETENRNGDENLVAPGQLLTHYAPDIDTRLVVPENTRQSKYPKVDRKDQGTDLDTPDLSKTVVIDFGGVLSQLQPSVLAYRDLSIQSSASEAAQSLFEALRWSEVQEGAKHVLLVDLLAVSDSCNGVDSEHLEAVADRMFRAASGKRISLDRLQSIK